MSAEPLGTESYLLWLTALPSKLAESAATRDVTAFIVVQAARKGEMPRLPPSGSQQFRS